MKFLLFLRFLSLLSASLLAGHAVAQPEDIFFEHVTVSDGLSQNSVHGIVQDRQGYLWFATQDGLNRYDGYEFVTYRHRAGESDPAPRQSLSNSTVWSLYEDRQGTLWAGTANGLNRYLPGSDTFEQYHHLPADPDSLSHETVRVILEDEVGNLWVGTARGGLNQMDRNSGRFTHFRHDANNPTTLSSDRIIALAVGSDGVLWVGTDDAGLNRFDVSTGTATRMLHDPDNINSLSSNDITALLVDSAGVLWVGTDTGGLNRVDPDTGEVRRYLHDPAQEASLSSNSIRTLYEDSQGRLWVGHYLGGGLDLFDRESNTFRQFRQQRGVANTLNDDHVLSVLEDRSGILWFGTHVGGLNKYDSKQARFRHYQHQWWNENSLSQNTVRSFYRNGRVLYIGTEGGLNVLDLDRGQFTHHSHDPSQAGGLPHNIVRAMDMDSQGQLWLATHGGLSRFDPVTQTFRNYFHEPGNPDSLSSNVIWRVLVDSTGLVWVGARDALNVLDPETGQVTRHVHDPQDPDSIAGDRISALYEDQAGDIWFSTMTTGVSRYNKTSAGFINYTHEPGNSNSLSNASVFSVTQDSDGGFWFGTRGGLSHFDPAAAQFRHYSVADGLPNDVIYGVLQDADGELWMSTNKGISSFDINTETFTNYGLSDGLQGEEFNNGAYFRGSQGEMYFGGINGFNTFHPDDIERNAYEPPVVITRFTVLNEDRVVNAFLDSMPEIELDYRENYLSFEFAALDYAAPSRNQYAYRLSGVDEHWIQSDLRRYASYTNLAPGQYVFQVMGSNSDGLWSREIAELRITITPAFWQTAWFQIALILLLVLLLVMMYRYKTVSVSRRNQALEATVNERTAQLRRANANLQQEVLLRKQAEEEISKIAYHDYLTGLPNRRLFMSLGEKALASAARDSTAAAVMFVDIDLFKEINDRWGHDVGDGVLVVLAQRITAVLRASDIVCRMGGDEFVVLLPDITDRQFAATVAEKLIASITREIEVSASASGEPIRVSVGVSIGISLYPADDNDLEKLLVQADQAMYDAKKDSATSFRFAEA